MVVAVIDTGIDYTHPDIAANMWRNTGEIPNNGIDDDGNGYTDDYYGYDFYDGDGDPFDTEGHGTHVAGTIGAVGNNDDGVSGVAWDVQLMAVRFLGRFGGSLSGAISSIDYAVANGAQILNNSWGGGGFSSSLQAAIQRAEANDVLFVAAAGNDNRNNDARPAYPASYNVPN
ncbi:MAG: S8 family serine peptidase, partial [Gemmataceae bacterium]